MAERLRSSEAPIVNTLYEDTIPIVWQEALGSNVLDVDGNRYIDFTAGFGAAGVGHRHPRVVAALAEQSACLVHGLADVHAHGVRIDLSERLRDMAPIDDPLVHHAISGADAVEIAVQSMILATGRAGVLAFTPSYHGLTLGALALTSRSHFREPFREWLPDTVTHLPWGCSREEVVEALSEDRIGGVIVEPTIGREGVVFPEPGWLAMLSEVCAGHGVLLAVDEIFTGFGRTGRTWACDHDTVRPDLLCCGKILGGGMPIAAVIGRSEVMAAWDRGGEALHTATFLANPMACAAALATLDVLEDERLVERSARLEPRMRGLFARFAEIEAVAGVRGRGLLWGVELHSARFAGRVVGRCLEEGLLILAAGESGSVLEICPPLSIAERQLEAGLDILFNVLITGEPS